MRHLIKIVIVLLLISSAWRYGHETFDRWAEHSTWASHSAGAAPVDTGSLLRLPSGEHFSPAENLERLDYKAIQSARHSLEISMCAFTDHHLASAVLAAARRGVEVRIYRDGGQYEEEQERAYRYGSTTDMFRGQPNIHIRVKQPSRIVMHEKDFLVDNVLLRTGSANWSASGEQRQDNEVDYVTDPQAIERFERNFDTLWRRSSNIVVQEHACVRVPYVPQPSTRKSSIHPAFGLPPF